MKLKVILKNGARLEQPKHEGDAGHDIYAVNYEIDRLHSTVKFNCKVAIQMPKTPLLLRLMGFKYVCDVRARSSVYKHQMILSNGVGTIDKPYTGEISLIYYYRPNNRWDIDRGVQNMMFDEYGLPKAVGQLLFTLVQTNITFKYVNSFKETSRGVNGYGSTNHNGIVVK